MPGSEIAVVVGHRHRLLAEALRRLLASMRGVRVVECVSDARELRAIGGAELFLLDARLPNLADVLARWTKSGRNPIVALLLPEAALDLVGTAFASVRGYVTPDMEADELREALLQLSRNERFLSRSLATRRRNAPKAALSPRQKEVAAMVALGFSSKEIAEILNISVRTVEGHRAQLMRKLDARNAANLVSLATSIGE